MTGTGDPVRPGEPPEQPWSPELLADLHAGALTGRAAARLRSRVTADPQARTVLAALDATVADLAALPARCPARMPDTVAQRLDAALAAAPRKPVMAARHRLRARWIGVGALAAAVTGVVMIGVLTGGAPRPGDALGAAAVSPPAPLALPGGDLSGALEQVLGARDYGPLSQPETLRRCLNANDVPVTDKPLGARQVTLNGQRGVLLILPTTRIAQFRLLVVGPDCGPNNPARIADDVTPRR